ncbi:MAG: hypothetical protein EU530_10855 [Promethearchaeota archaeon]|nr:MAG: hypothetical protein EU530_10855 [Candidatus Lokiarchaeota archaeon]
MKIFLDSTYLFPLIEIEITEGWTKSQLLDLISKPDYQGLYCDLSIFEIFTKVSKLINKHQIKLEIDDVVCGIHTIRYMPKTRPLKWYNYLFEAPMFLELKNHHSDSIDCMIFYLAVLNSDTLVTFNRRMIKHWKNVDKIRKWVKVMNPGFSIGFDSLKDAKVLFLELIE